MMTTRRRFIDHMIARTVKRVFRYLASLKVAIPLLVVTVVVTVIGSLFPQPDVFRTWWYLALLGALGVSLLFITVLHIPSILRRKGRNALIGVIATHLGILVLIAGAIHGGTSGFRHKIRVVEGEMRVVPGLPFAILLDELLIEEYRPDEFPSLNPGAIPKKRQDSRITLYQRGEAWRSMVIAPGMPAKVEGTTLLPSVTDIGWYFELVVTDQLGREKTIPVRPWAPPLVTIGERDFMAHSVAAGNIESAELLAIDEAGLTSVGFVSSDKPLSVEGNSVTLGQVKRYTSLVVYNRPQEPLLLAGCILMLAGLVWHFYHRHRERGNGAGDDKNHA